MRQVADERKASFSFFASEEGAKIRKMTKPSFKFLATKTELAFFLGFDFLSSMICIGFPMIRSSVLSGAVRSLRL